MHLGRWHLTYLQYLAEFSRFTNLQVNFEVPAADHTPTPRTRLAEVVQGLEIRPDAFSYL